MNKKEIRIQEALGVIHRYRVIVYHDDYKLSRSPPKGFPPSPHASKSTANIVQYIHDLERIIYSTVIVLACNEEDACSCIYDKYKVGDMIDTGVSATKYIGEASVDYVAKKIKRV